MQTIDILFGLSNGLFLLASYPMMKEVIKNKDVLKGFSFKGSLCTFLGMFITLIAFGFLQTYSSVLIAFPTFIYWGIVTYYTRGDKK